MKALTWLGGSDLTWGEVSAPEKPDDEVVVQVRCASICGSDLHAYRGQPGPRVPPLILGHEAVCDFAGERYVPFPLLTCGNCPACRTGKENLCPDWELLGIHRPGVFADRFAIPRSLLLPVPDGLSDDRAVLTEPLACVVGAFEGTELSDGTTVAVIGCGPIGLLGAAYAVNRGAQVIAVDPMAERRQIAQRLGAQRVAEHADSLRDVDLLLDAAGVPATWAAGINAVRPGGRVVVVGLGRAVGEVPMAALVRRSVVLQGHFAYTRANFGDALGFLARETFDLGWTQPMDMDRGVDAFHSLVHDPSHFIKVILRVTRDH